MVKIIFVFSRRVHDRQSGGDLVLNDEQVNKILAIAESRYPTIGYNPYEPFLDIFSSQKEIHPISNRPDDKRSFIPSLDERRLVGRLVHSIKMGWRKKKEEKTDDDELPVIVKYTGWAIINTPICFVDNFFVFLYFFNIFFLICSLYLRNFFGIKCCCSLLF